MRIYLLGYMGSGKTTLGKALAKQMKFHFTDLDHFIEDKLNKKIADLFETEGENGFRLIEKKYLQETGSMENTIISCGGGTPCFFDNMQWMNNNGTTIYLKMSVDGLFNRLLNGKEARPLLKNLSDEQMKAFINLNLEKREPYYSQAHYSIKGESLKVEQVLALLPKN